MAWMDVAGVDEIPVNDMRKYTIDGVDILVYHTSDGFFATSDTCTHADCSLSEGDMEGGEIVCWCHGGAFNIRTGTATRMPCVIPVETFPVRLQGQIIQVDVS